MCIVDVVQLLEPVKEMLHTELTHKLTSTDAALKDSISKLVRSKVTVQLLLSEPITVKKYMIGTLDQTEICVTAKI